MTKTIKQQAVAAIKANGEKATVSAIGAMVQQMQMIAAPTAVDKAKAKAKTAPVTKDQTASKTAKPAVKAFNTAIKFIVNGNGATKLFAHTAAWLELSGLIHGKEFPADIATKIGGTALAYHTRKGNFTESQGMVRLTAKGLAKFQEREQGGAQGFAIEDKEHYMLMMMEGLHDARLVKNAATIVPVAAVKA